MKACDPKTKKYFLLCTISATSLLWRSLPFSHVFIYYVFSSYYVTVFSPCGFLPFSRPLVWVLLFPRCVFGFLCILVFFFIWISFRAYLRWFKCIKICSALFSIIWCSRVDFTTRLLLIRRRRIVDRGRSPTCYMPLFLFRFHFENISQLLFRFLAVFWITIFLYRESWRLQFQISPCSVFEILVRGSSPPNKL